MGKNTHVLDVLACLSSYGSYGIPILHMFPGGSSWALQAHWGPWVKAQDPIWRTGPPQEGGTSLPHHFAPWPSWQLIEKSWNHLVGGWPTPLKNYEFVSWDDYPIYSGQIKNWLVMVWTVLKNISQLGLLFPIYGKIKCSKPPTSGGCFQDSKLAILKDSQRFSD